MSKIPEVQQLIKDTWSEEAQFRVKQKVDKCRFTIINWCKEQQAEIKATLENLKRQINQIMSASNPNENLLKELYEKLKKNLYARGRALAPEKQTAMAQPWG